MAALQTSLFGNFSQPYQFSSSTENNHRHQRKTRLSVLHRGKTREPSGS